MAEEEVNFLRDQVQRLNSVLAQYQDKYPTIGIKQDGNSAAPWQTDHNLVSPLLIEYDAQNQVLQQQVESYKRDHRELRNQVDKLVAENTRLNRELKELTRMQLDRSETDAMGSEDTDHDDQVLHNLQSQLQMALQEKENAMEMWQASVQEVERLEQEVQSQGVNPRIQQLQQTTERIKQQYTKTVHELNNEISLLQDELRRSKNELKANNIQVTDLRRTLEEMKAQIMRKDYDIANAEGEGSIAGGKLQEFQHSISDLQTKLEDSNKELSYLRQEKLTMETRVLELQKKLTAIESKEYEAVLQVKESTQLVENAMLEKDQALVREIQAQEQVEKMKEALSKLVEEAGVRTRQEVDNVKKQCNQNIARLMEEIHALELQKSEGETQVERAIREKRSVESELEKLYKEGLVQTNKDGSLRDELNRRACEAERMRDEAMIKADSFQTQLRREDITHKQEKAKLNSEIEHLKDRLECLSREFEDANNERVKFTEEVDKLKRAAQKYKAEKDSAQRTYTKEMTCFERDIRMKEQNFEVKLQSLEDAHRQSMMELRQMLAAQQRMSAKWKEECNTITQKFEQKVNDLRSDISRHKKRCEELTRLLRESKEKNLEAEHMISEYGRNIKRMEDRVKDAENRASNASLQVAKQLSKARQMLHTSSSSSINRSFHDTNKSKISGTPDPLQISDLGPKHTSEKTHITFSENTEMRDNR